MKNEKGERRLAKLDELANKGEMRGLSTPSPLRGCPPCLRGRKSMGNADRPLCLVPVGEKSNVKPIYET